MFTKLDAKGSGKSSSAEAVAAPDDSGRKLLAWFHRTRRPLPWRNTSDPYRIWISEVMLQQTRAAAAVPYYERFLRRFPDLNSLAQSSETELLRYWSGLGYYSRARNLRRAARYIVSRMGGAFSSRYADWKELPGVGPYTAAAVASIAFGEPVAVLDGNVARVLARMTNHSGDIRSARVREALRRRAQAWLEATRSGGKGGSHTPETANTAGNFNQALMELGATICVAQNPRCSLCPVAAHCQALLLGTQNGLPVRLESRRPVRLRIAVAVVERGRKLLLRQRPPHSSQMPGFWELPQAENEQPDPDCLASLGLTLKERLREFRHSITYHNYTITVFRAALRGPTPQGFRWRAVEELPEIPLTTITKKALKTIAAV
jgi:A/G-specific adenine glycosylase